MKNSAYQWKKYTHVFACPQFWKIQEIFKNSFLYDDNDKKCQMVHHTFQNKASRPKTEAIWNSYFYF